MERADAPVAEQSGGGRDSAKTMTLEARAQRAAAWLDANSRRLAWAAIGAGAAAAVGSGVGDCPAQATVSSTGLGPAGAGFSVRSSLAYGSTKWAANLPPIR